MGNAMEQFLLSDSQPSGVSAEVLELLGRKAAHQFLEQGVSLNDAVRETLHDHPEFNNEHIKRVIEFANNVAFQELFQQSGEDKNIHFDVADPGTVIRDLKDGGTPAQDGKVMGSSGKDYNTPPKMEKDQFGDPESGMQHLQMMENNSGQFGQGEQVEKNAYEIKPEDRPDIPKKDFAQPGKEEAGHKGKYPIPDEQHARSALGFAKMHHDTKAYAAVRAKVEKKFPGMVEGGGEEKTAMPQPEFEKRFMRGEYWSPEKKQEFWTKYGPHTKEKESCGDSCKLAEDWHVAGLEDDLVGQFLKNAAPESFAELNQTEHANPIENVYALQSHLEGARVKLAEAHEQFDLLAKEACEDLYQTIKHECLAADGAGLGGVVNALSKVSEDHEVLGILSDIVERMVGEGVPNARLEHSLTKTAGAPQLVNLDHPILRAWSGLEKIGQELLRSTAALAEIDEGLEMTRSFFQHLGR